MPTNVDLFTIKDIAPSKDKRRKLSDYDKQEIRELYTKGEPIRSISRLFPQVSRRMIQFVLFPERVTSMCQNRKALLPSWESSRKEARRVYMASHRNHKRNILLNINKNI